MNTSDSNRFLQVASGLALVVLVVGGALYIGSGATGDVAGSSSESNGDGGGEAPAALSGPNFEVEPVDLKLGPDGVEQAEKAAGEPGAEEPGAEDGPIRKAIGPSGALLQMASDPHVQPDSEQGDVEAFVRSLMPGAEQCWSRAAGNFRGTWNIILRASPSGLDSSRSRLRGLKDYKLDRCLKDVLSSADATALDDSALRAHWPVTLDPSDGVQMD